jgi:hypothetical protein
MLPQPVLPQPMLPQPVMQMPAQQFAQQPMVPQAMPVGLHRRDAMAPQPYVNLAGPVLPAPVLPKAPPMKEKGTAESRTNIKFSYTVAKAAK